MVLADALARTISHLQLPRRSGLDPPHLLTECVEDEIRQPAR
ncbi:hypothetical protein [Kribbella sp. NPDC049584]